MAQSGAAGVVPKLPPKNGVDIDAWWGTLDWMGWDGIGLDWI